MTQIGISSHKNSYSAKTLISNYDEERRAWEAMKQMTTPKLDSTTTTRTAYKAYSPTEVERQKPYYKSSLDPKLMFSHQKGATSQYVSTNDMTFTSNDSLRFTRTEKLLSGAKGEPSVEPRRRLLEQKQKQWDQERNEMYYRK